MAWRVAGAIETFRDQLNARYPNRSKISDGYIGDAAHRRQGSASDHNPWVHWNQPIVTAGDFTKDLGVGVDTDRITDELERSRDNRIKYVIANGFIMSGDQGPHPWVWRRRPDGSSYGHYQHVHISVKSDARFGDDRRPWNIPTFGGGVEELKPDERHALEDLRQQLRGRWGSKAIDPNAGAKEDGLTLNQFVFWSHAHSISTKDLAAELKARTGRQNETIKRLAAKVANVHGLDEEALLAGIESSIQDGVREALPLTLTLDLQEDE